MRAMSVAVAASSARRSATVVKPIWLFTMTWIVPPTRVPSSPRHVQRLGDDALAGERRVAVDEDRQRAAARSRVARSGPASRGRAPAPPVSIHSRWLGLNASERCTVRAVGGLAIGRVAEVVLHVAAAGVDDRASSRNAAKISRERLADDVREHVEAAAVRHADDDVLHAVADGAIDERARAAAGGPRRPRARSASRRGSCVRDELLEHLRLDQLLEQPLLRVGRERERGSASRSIRCSSQRAQVGVVDVRELDADACGSRSPRAARRARAASVAAALRDRRRGGRGRARRDRTSPSASRSARRVRPSGSSSARRWPYSRYA